MKNKQINNGTRKCQVARLPSCQSQRVVTIAVPTQLCEAVQYSAVPSVLISAVLAVSFVVLAILFRELRRRDCVHIEFAVLTLGGLFEKGQKGISNTDRFNVSSNTDVVRN
jgi:hypothetical protein